jgi:AbrB family looped-hinge helix DNA binding protein
MNLRFLPNSGKNKVGKMAQAITKIDEKGRITIPNVIRKKAGIKPGTYVSVKSKDNLIIIEPSESIAEKYSEIFQISKWPEDLDGFFAEATEKWRTQQGT